MRLASPRLLFVLHDDWPDICQFQPEWTSPRHHDLSVTEESLPFTAGALQKTFLLLFTSPMHLNSSSVLAFSVCLPPAQVKLPYSSQTACSFFVLPSVHFPLCSPLTDNYQSFCTQRKREWEMELRRLSLKTSQLPGSLSFRVTSYRIAPPVSWASRCLFSCSPRELIYYAPCHHDNFKYNCFVVAAAKTVISNCIPKLYSSLFPSSSSGRTTMGVSLSNTCIKNSETTTSGVGCSF